MKWLISFLSKYSSSFKVKTIFMFLRVFPHPVIGKIISMNIIPPNFKNFIYMLKGDLSLAIKCDVNSFIVKLGYAKWVKVVYGKKGFL